MSHIRTHALNRSAVTQALPGLALAGVLAAGGEVARRRRHSLLTVEPQARGDHLAPVVDVVVPARGATAEIAGCVLSLWAAGANRVVVVDQASDRSTARLAAAVGAEVVTPQATPPGWTAGAYASWVGAEKTTASWLAFVSGDVRLAPGTLDALVELCERWRLDAVSPLLTWPAAGMWERLRLPVLSWEMLAGLPPSGRGALHSRCLLTRREAYERSGGHAHASVRSRPAEAAMLARQLTAAGGAVGLVAGAGAGRMRPRAEARRQGPAAEVVALLAQDRRRAAIAATASTALTLVPFLLARTLWRATPGRLVGAAAAAGTAALALAPEYRRHGEPSRLALLHPAASLSANLAAAAWLGKALVSRGAERGASSPAPVPRPRRPAVAGGGRIVATATGPRPVP